MDQKRKDQEKDDKIKPNRGEKDDKYEIERGNEPHKKKEFPDAEEDQTR